MMPAAGRTRFIFAAALAAGAWILPASARAQSLVVRNNHELPYSGAIQTPVALPDGHYRGKSGNDVAAAEVRQGMARIDVALGTRGTVRLERAGSPGSTPFAAGPLSIAAGAGTTNIRWSNRTAAQLEFDLIAINGTAGEVDSAVARFSAIEIPWKRNADGTLSGAVERSGFAVSLVLSPYASGSLEVRARVSRTGTGTGAIGNTGYLALVRRVTAPGATGARSRFNGREMEGGESPSTWDRDFWYTRGVDWTTWRAGDLSFLSVNGFSPVPTIMRNGVWVEGSHFYVWERTRQRADAMYFVSEIAGPNADQAKSRYMPVTPYASLLGGDTVSLKWRLAVAPVPAKGWEESQLRGFAGYRSTQSADRVVTIDLGVRSVMFGTSYFPYSTFGENFDYYRVPGMSSEAFWPISPTMWSKWREYIPRMRTDLRIARAMGFEAIRMHHMELLQKLERREALAFLDFFANELRSLQLKLFIDTEGPAEWVSTVVARHADLVTHVELENEVLIGGIKPGDAARWTSLYNAAKSAAPKADVFLTAAGNNAMFSRLQALGVPFDRVGLHAYKHGPQWKEAYSSHALGTAGFASDMGKSMTIGEFNWKDMTRMSPELRRGEVAEVYERLLSSRSVPELIEFQFHESLTFNPSVSGSASRHYEPLSLDRRPKRESFGLMKVIHDYGRPDAPAREMPIIVDEAKAVGGRATVAYTVTNSTGKPVSGMVTSSAFDGISSTLNAPNRFTLRPGERKRGSVTVTLANARAFGTYHHFVEVKHGSKVSTGWGIVANEGAPTFNTASVLGDRVVYPEGSDVVSRVDWARPLAVAFGAEASVLELESAFQLANTLQAATGKQVRISSVDDLPDSVNRRGVVLLVGTPTSNALVARDQPQTGKPGNGSIALRTSGAQYLLLTGADAKGVQAAVVELLLRYWPNARVAALRTMGMEKGAALGNRVGGPAVDPP